MSHNLSIATFVRRDRLGSVQTHRNGHDKNLLDKVWVFSAYHRLEPIRERLFDTIEPGKKSVLSVLTSNHHVSKNLVSSCQSHCLLHRERNTCMLARHVRETYCKDAAQADVTLHDS